MRILPGIAASPGVAIGEALIIDREGFRIPRRYIARGAEEDECRRLDAAVDEVAHELSRNRTAITRQLGDQYGAIFDAHLQMLRDPGLQREITQRIEKEYHTAEFAVSRTIRRYTQLLQLSPNSYLAERAHDLFDIERHLLSSLLGGQRAPLANLSSPVVILAHDLTPSETASLERKLMFPMITTLSDLRQAKTVLADAMEDLDDLGVPFDRAIEIGMMVEVPAAVVLLDRFLPEVSFLSIGTNDLIQFALAVDRANNVVADRYQTSDPAVLRLIEATLKQAHAAGVPVAVCGQMSGEILYTMLLLGLGLRELSVPPAVIPEIKIVCRRVTREQCERVAHRAMTMENSMEIDKFLREELRKAAPELADNDSGP